jgi:[protein-PII] uridylyltransferase
VGAVATAAPSERLSLGVRPGPTPDSFELTVIAHDRPEMFSRIAGALSLAGLDILSADAFAAPDRLALDVFIVESSTLRPVEHETWTTFERLLRAALADRYELKTRLDERRRLYPSRTRARTTVVVSPSEYDTAVRVTAPDRPGLLHDVSQAISSSGFDIRWARVITVEGTAIDTFHVVGSDGGPITDEGELGHMAMRLRAIG